jgi:hypothetical protein
VCSENSRGRKKPEYYNNVWSYDFLTEHPENSRRAGLPVVIDEYTIDVESPAATHLKTFEHNHHASSIVPA